MILSRFLERFRRYGTPSSVARPSVYTLQRLSVLVALACAVTADTRAQYDVTPVGPAAFGGRTRALIVVEGLSGSTEVLLAGSVGGGLWRSRDAGASWESVTNMADVSVTSIVADPNNPLTLYAGTGDIDQSLPGGGIFRSSDGGKSWTLIPNTDREELAFIRRLSVSADGSEILAATSEGLYGSSTSSFDFQCVLPSPYACTEQMSDVAFHPSDRSRAVAASAETAAVYYRNGVTGRTAWQESQAQYQYPAEPPQFDSTWKVWNGSVAVTYARADPNVVYASMDGSGTDLFGFQDTPFPPIWRSDDGGKIFKPRDSDRAPCVSHLKVVKSLDGWANLIWAGHPTNSDFLILGRVDLWRSTDGGTSLTLISDYDKHPDSAHADHHVLSTKSNFATGANDPFQAWIGTDGGVFHTTNVTAAGRPCEPVAWSERNQGYAAPQFYSGVALSDGTLLAGTQDLGLLRRKPWPACAAGSSCWTVGEIAKGSSPRTRVRDDIVTVIAHPTRPLTAFALGSGFDVLRTTDAGETWEYISDIRWNGTAWKWRKGLYWPVENQTDLRNSVLAIDSRQQPHLYLAGGCLYRSSNPISSRPNWEWMPAPVRKTACASAPYVSVVAATPTVPDDLWLCYDDGRVFRTKNALSNPPPAWHRVRGGPDSHRRRPCQSIEVSGVGTALIAFAGVERPNVFSVRDTGAANPRYAWTPLTLPEDTRPYRATAHPNDPRRIFVATESGVFEKLVSGSWRALPGVPRHRTQTLFWHGDDKLYVGTYGAGIYAVEVP